LAGIGVFAAIGFLVASTGVAVDEVARDGIGLAFVVFPEIISQMPGPSGLYGVLFFGSLVLAGLSSLISITQTYIAAIQEKFSLTRRRSVALAGGGTALVSLVYATGGGINTLDVVDRFINAFGIAAVGLVEVIVVAWFVRSLPRLRHHANRVSDLRLGLWWIAALGVITPVVLGWMTIDNLMTEFETPYEGYPMTFLVVFGWGVAGLALVVGLALSFAPWPDDIDIRAPHESDEPHGGRGPSGPGRPPESAGGTEPAEPTEPAQPTDRGTEGAS
jgi:neurotransmitter:Na+ symporter, NSS family